jgi:hypothetical protein
MAELKLSGNHLKGSRPVLSFHKVSEAASQWGVCGCMLFYDHQYDKAGTILLLHCLIVRYTHPRLCTPVLMLGVSEWVGACIVVLPPN